MIVRRYLSPKPYEPVWQAMQHFTATRQSNTPDEIWLLQHHPVFTLGLAGKTEHLLTRDNTPVVHCDRGGQITWHGPGQLVCYLLLDTQRGGFGARQLVSLMEQALIKTLENWGVQGCTQTGKPGVYVEQQGRFAKLGALGLKIRKKGCYHGLSLNLDCDLAAFKQINPCGYPAMPVTRLHDLCQTMPAVSDIEATLVQHLTNHLYKTHPLPWPKTVWMTRDD